MLWIRNEKTLWKASFRRREITDVIPLLFLQRGAILLSGNTPTIKITLWGLSTPQNAPFLGAIYPKKRCTFFNVVGSYAINVPPTCLQSRPTHPVKSAFYTILLRFSWDIGIFSITTPLTAKGSRKTSFFVFKVLEEPRLSIICHMFVHKTSVSVDKQNKTTTFVHKNLHFVDKCE